MKDLIEKYRHVTLNNLENIDTQNINEIVNCLWDSLNAGTSIFTMGNGGSASTADHIVNDLLNIANRCESRSLIQSLSSNSAVLTCIANDNGFKNIFRSQLLNVIKKNDIVIAFSVSGNSPNILSTIPIIKNSGAKLISFTGFDGGALKEQSDLNLHIQGEAGFFGPPEGLHLLYAHLISDLIKNKI